MDKQTHTTDRQNIRGDRHPDRGEDSLTSGATGVQYSHGGKYGRRGALQPVVDSVSSLNDSFHASITQETNCRLSSKDNSFYDTQYTECALYTHLHNLKLRM